MSRADDTTPRDLDGCLRVLIPLLLGPTVFWAGWNLVLTEILPVPVLAWWQAWLLLMGFRMLHRPWRPL